MPKFITQDQLRALLEKEYGPDTYVLFDNPEEMNKQLAAGKPDNIWYLDHNKHVIRMGSNRFFDLRMHDHGGYTLPCIWEEPDIEVPSDGAPRVVGTLIVALNSRGEVRVNERRSIDGATFFQASQWSASNPNQVSIDQLVIKNEAFLNWNAQRIGGYVRAILIDDDSPLAPGDSFMTIDELVISTSDARTLTALKKLGL